jgi:hypothetical protein
MSEFTAEMQIQGHIRTKLPHKYLSDTLLFSVQTQAPIVSLLITIFFVHRISSTRCTRRPINPVPEICFGRQFILFIHVMELCIISFVDCIDYFL